MTSRILEKYIINGIWSHRSTKEVSQWSNANFLRPSPAGGKVSSASKEMQAPRLPLLRFPLRVCLNTWPRSRWCKMLKNWVEDIVLSCVGRCHTGRGWGSMCILWLSVTWLRWGVWEENPEPAYSLGLAYREFGGVPSWKTEKIPFEMVSMRIVFDIYLASSMYLPVLGDLE